MRTKTHDGEATRQTRQVDLGTSVERYVSCMKDSNGTDRSRGFVWFTGLARVTLAVARLAVVVHLPASEARKLEDVARRTCHGDGH